MARHQRRRRVAITGMGAVTSLGLEVETIWAAVAAGNSGVGYVEQFDSRPLPIRIGSEVDLASLPDDDLDGYLPPTVRAARFAAYASGRAWRDAGLDLEPPNPASGAVCVGASTFPLIEDRLDLVADLLDGERLNNANYLALCRQRPELLAQTDMPAVSTLLSRRFGLGAASLTVQAACTSATQAIGHSFRLVQSGAADLALTGGTDSMLSLMCVSGFTLLGSLSRRSDEPERASRPFDRKRDGFVVGEGAAFFVLEELERARRRGARIHAELIAYGSSCDAYRFTDVHPQGAGAAASMRAALAEAGIRSEEVGYVNAHGTSTPQNDPVETKAIKDVFGAHAYRLPVSSTKSQLGHLLCAAGAIELTFTVQTLKNGFLPPTINLENPDPECDLDYVAGHGREADVRFALSNSFGFGGQNGTLLVRRWNHEGTAGEATTAAKPVAKVENVVAAAMSRRPVDRRVVVTGLGAISPLGLSAREHYRRLLAGESAVCAATDPQLAQLPISFDSRVRGFDKRNHLGERMLRKILRPAAAYAVAAAAEALDDAGLTAHEEELAGCALHVGSLGLDLDLNLFGPALRASLTPAGDFDLGRFSSTGMGLIDPLFLVKSLPNSGICGASIELEILGPSLNIMNGATSGLLAVATAAEEIRSGRSQRALAGAYDSQLQLEVAIAHLLGGRLAPNGLEPSAACRPLSAMGRGYVLGEGSVFLMLEDAVEAARRGARVYGELLGGGQRAGDAAPGRSLESASRQALDAAGLAGDDVEVFFGQGLGVPREDLLEAEVANRLVEGRGQAKRRPWTASTPAHGYLGAAHGVFSLLHSLLALDQQRLPPTLNCDGPAPDPFEPVRQATDLPFATALVWTCDRGADSVALAVGRATAEATVGSREPL